ncbi:exonuclease SbcC [Pseudanabaena sp. lw0831]|uniref:AAA family ATPase n=1 Tax=Pseudanabaena sp. lw0831 TaxID=1357935 RepID=UPI0019162153|nr:AAA family ATPase [Pseudanabaena sp. lw0831]GBO55087.1 exonuclease SbcC [Pseudanabaena sp. lw0831]
MKLISIKLFNFRCFYQQTPEIMLARLDDRNITIMHGNNGTGKTSLLNAFTWVLYEKFTSAFGDPEQLVNRQAIAESQLNQPVECWAEVLFEHDAKRYRVRRLTRAYKLANNGEKNIQYCKSELFLQVAGDDGRWVTQNHPEAVINGILPRSLHQYFFFDGERIEQIVRSDNRNEIAEATKKLLGVQVLDNAIKHLKEARKSLEDELKNIGDAQTKTLISQKQKLENDSAECEVRIKEIEQELDSQNQLKASCNQRLTELGGIDEIQKRRENLELQEKETRSNLRGVKNELKEAISKQGYSVFLPQAIANFRELVGGLHERGELPADIKQTFVLDLLERRKCICGAALHDDSPNYEQVRSWLEKAGLADVETATLKLEGFVDEVEKQATDFWQGIDTKQASISHVKNTLSRLELELESISEQLRKSPVEDIRQMQTRLDEIDRKVEDLNLEKGKKLQKWTDYQGQIENLQKQIKSSKQNEGKQKLAQKRIDAAQQAIDLLIELKTNRNELFRKQLETRIDEIFSQISFKAQIPRLSEKYELSLVETVAGQEVQSGASTGENQILSLSFIGSIIDRVREWSKSGLVMGPDSSTFPIVMDSPFGSLDEIYRRQVARLIPQLANQLVVMVSKTQWRVEVEEEMTPRIGKEYVFVFNSNKPDTQTDDIILYGKSYPLVRKSAYDYEYTEVLEVNHG